MHTDTHALNAKVSVKRQLLVPF